MIRSTSDSARITILPRRLPGLSETNYKVLAGVTALGVAAPALLFVSNVVLPEVTKAKPPAKKPAAGAKAPAST